MALPPLAESPLAELTLAERSSTELVPRRTRDGSFSLYSPVFHQGFHCADGALAEARRVFVVPAELQRFPAGWTLRVLEVAVGTGTNTAALLQGCQDRGLHLDWWGLELDPLPLRLALADDGFRRQWPPAVLRRLQTLTGSQRLLWGDGRARLSQLRERLAGRCDLVLHDGFSPRHCPQLWSQEFLQDLAGLLAPRGRLLTYCSAAAVRRALLLAGLQLAAICAPGSAAIEQASVTTATTASGTKTNARTDGRTEGRTQGLTEGGTEASPDQGGEASSDWSGNERTEGTGEPPSLERPEQRGNADARWATTGWEEPRSEGDPPATSVALRGARAPGRSGERAEATSGSPGSIWSAGTAASPTELPLGGVLRSLSAMELEHLACRAGEPYRDPGRNGTAAAILERRQQQQSVSTAEPSRQWQRRWGLARRHGPPQQLAAPTQLAATTEPAAATQPTS